jgi:hypothetical protein
MQTGSHSHYAFSGDFLVFVQACHDTEKLCLLNVKGFAGRVAVLPSAARKVHFQFENFNLSLASVQIFLRKKSVGGWLNPGVIGTLFRHVFYFLKLSHQIRYCIFSTSPAA